MHKFRFVNMPESMSKFLTRIALENKCKVKRQLQSKFNPSHTFEYPLDRQLERYLIDGFKIILTVSTYSKQHLNYVRHLYFNRITLIRQLNHTYYGSKPEGCKVKQHEKKN